MPFVLIGLNGSGKPEPVSNSYWSAISRIVPFVQTSTDVIKSFPKIKHASAAPGGPLGPVGPVSPCNPAGPVGPLGPWRPLGP
ncbi:hypothetical protein Klosneuvirus_1_419 [Klosneuvirus KNV1]|uniref:Uncharacterized protein n=1 Tax=Klosneuvirus KNV1 TaxID=1977640 RepID=A0A1V0SIL1_9VIRU|nr:hypothetical protein Klosneuvirus_1_419 [Klosneuvirus KNV1]